MRSVVLSGFAGTGKSTVAPLVASMLALPWVDTDREIEARAGVTVAELWRTRGEVVFRELEGEVVRAIFAEDVPRVVSFGGGTVTARELRHLALDRSFVVTLACRPETLMASRLGELALRPTLVARDPLARVRALLGDREDAYAECHLYLPTDDLSPEEAAARIARASQCARVAVALGSRSYGVDIVLDSPPALSQLLAGLAPSSLLVVSDRNVLAARSAALAAALEPIHVPVFEVTLDPGEENKTLASVERIWSAALGNVDRDAVVVGFGGGVVGDLAAFAASTLLRGLRVVESPTTLLAMVDASVGGKTGFDVAAGKNLIGTFHQPSGVVGDHAHLTTLPHREFLCGLAEIAKVALACDERLFLELEENAERLAAMDLAALSPVILRSIAIKARVVREDEREAAGRKLLNLGHTIAHALEAAGGYASLRHGEAVAIGLVVECRIAERLGLSPAGLADRVERVLARMQLPTAVPPEQLAAAWPLVANDKKRAGDVISLPLVTGVGACVVEAVSLRELTGAGSGSPHG